MFLRVSVSLRVEGILIKYSVIVSTYRGGEGVSDLLLLLLA